MGFLDELKRLTHPYEDDMEDDYDEDEEDEAEADGFLWLLFHSSAGFSVNST